jgi:hypothetical protein
MDREMCCDFAGVELNSFVQFAKSCIANYDNGGRQAMLKAANYLYAGLKSTDAESNFLASPDGFSDDEEPELKEI